MASQASSKSKKRGLEQEQLQQASSSMQEQMQHALKEFFKELDDIADEEKQGFLKARDENPILLETESPPERFLLCEATATSTSSCSSNGNKTKTKAAQLFKFDAKQAARRFVDYWEKRVKIFEEDAFKPMLTARRQEQPDNKMDKNSNKHAGGGCTGGALKVPYGLEHILNNGLMSILPCDQHGRPVLCVDMTIATPLHQTLCPNIAMKCLFYLLQVVSEQERSQTHGLVGICIFDKTNYDARIMALGLEYESLGKALPVKLGALHVICPLDKQQEKEFFTEALPVALCARGNGGMTPSSGDNNSTNNNSSSNTVPAQVHESVDVSTIMSRLQAVGLEPRSVPLSAGGESTPHHVAQWFAHRQNLELAKLLEHYVKRDAVAYVAQIQQKFQTTYSPPKDDKKRRNNNKDTRNRRIRIKAKTDANEMCQEYLWRDKEREHDEKERLRRENEMLRTQMLLGRGASGGIGGGGVAGASSSFAAQTLLMFAQHGSSSCSPTTTAHYQQQQQHQPQSPPPLLQAVASDNSTEDTSLGDSSSCLDTSAGAAATSVDAVALQGQQQQLEEGIHRQQTIMTAEAAPTDAQPPVVRRENGNKRRKGILVSQFISMALFLIVGVSSIALLAFRGEQSPEEVSSSSSAATKATNRISNSRAMLDADKQSSLERIQLSPTPVVNIHRAFGSGAHYHESTMESVIQYGKLRCGVQDFSLAYHADPDTCQRKSMEIDLCSAVAAAVLGDAQAYELVQLLIDERFIALNNQTIDLYLRAAPTMERDVFEKTAGAGFAFSVPYGYGTVRMGGHSLFVDCADERDTRGECSNLKVCVIKGSLHVHMVGLPKPYLVERELDDMLSGLLEGRCNVAVGHTPDLEKALLLVPNHFPVKLGKRVLSSEPLAIATRDDDPRWSDLVNWVLLALMSADDQGNTQGLAGYFPSTTSFGRRFERMFQDAIGSVGSFLEIRNRYSDGVHNRTPRDALRFINQHELSGALLSPDLGNADRVGPEPISDGYIAKVVDRGYLICGITDQRAGFAQLNPNTGRWSGLDVDFCRAVSASLFHGNPDYYMEIVDFDAASPYYPFDEAFGALADGRVDVLAGMKLNFERDVFEPLCGQGFSFSLPYYYDNERLGETRALASRQDDSQWSSFVYWTVASIIKAEEKEIKGANSNKMPVVKLYGNNFTGMLRDAIMYVGNYDEIYSRNLEAFIPRRGLNMLNLEKIGQQLRH